MGFWRGVSPGGAPGWWVLPLLSVVGVCGWFWGCRSSVWVGEFWQDFCGDRGGLPSREEQPGGNTVGGPAERFLWFDF